VIVGTLNQLRKGIRNQKESEICQKRSLGSKVRRSKEPFSSFVFRVIKISLHRAAESKGFFKHNRRCIGALPIISYQTAAGSQQLSYQSKEISVVDRHFLEPLKRAYSPA
jgi:hypothetical protein